MFAIVIRASQVEQIIIIFLQNYLLLKSGQAIYPKLFYFLIDSYQLSWQLNIIQVVEMHLLRKRLAISFFRPHGFRSFAQQEKFADHKNEEKLQREKQIEFRKRLMEENQIKSFKEHIETTKGDFNPIIQYIKLFKSHLLYLALFGCLATVAAILIKIAGIHEDTFTKKKKFVLVSDEFECKLDGNLRQTFTTLFGFAEKGGSRLQEECRRLQRYIKQITNRNYKIVLVQSEDKVMIVLPGSIILSRNLLLSNDRSDLQKSLVLMEALFIKKTHIKELAFSNLGHFVTHWIKPTNVSDVNMIKIYSRPYSAQEIQQSFKDIQKHYSLPAQDIRDSILALIGSGSKNMSAFSLQNRINLHATPNS